jgi:glycerophosphoryl diester phosphodiesterase
VRRAAKPKPALPLVAAAVLSLVGCDPDGLGRSNPNFLVVGHHGAPNLAAENTVNSFKAAVAVGANAIEADFCITGDNVIVAFHDRDPDSPIAIARQAGGEGYAWLPFVPPVGSSWRRPVNALTLAELRVHYGYRLAEGGRDFDAAIPTLREVLDWCASEPELRAL